MCAREDIAFLVGSATRVELLQALADCPSRPTELAERCSCARETAQRTLGGFVERGWVTNSEGRYRLTPGGSNVLDQYREFGEVIRGADRLETLLTNLGTVAEGFPTQIYDEVTVTEASKTDPHAPIDRYLTFLGGEPVGSFEGVTPVVSRVYNEAATAIIGQETEMELVVDDSVLAVSQTDYPEALQRANQLEQFTLLLTPEDIDFGLAIVDGRAYVGAYDENNNLVASVDGDSEPLLAWAREVYRGYRQSATALERRLA
jgi:predicted transcriptional regulator